MSATYILKHYRVQGSGERTNGGRQITPDSKTVNMADAQQIKWYCQNVQTHKNPKDIKVVTEYAQLDIIDGAIMVPMSIQGAAAALEGKTVLNIVEVDDRY